MHHATKYNGEDLLALSMQYCEKGLASSTSNTYASTKKRFLLFCEHFYVSPLPVSEKLCNFAAFLAMEGRGYLIKE